MIFSGLNRRQALFRIATISATLPVASSRLIAAASLPSTKRFTELFGSPVRGRIQLDRADYDIGATTLSWNLSNIWVKGASGGSRIHGTARTLLSLQTSHDCVFEDIVFEVTAHAGTSSSYEAVVRAAHVVVRNHRFIRCRFIVRNANQNALKLIAETGDARIEGLHFEDSTIDGAGRMGIELQNHGKDAVERLIDFRWEGGAVRDTGLLNGAGMGISLSGIGTDHVVDTLFENNRFAALENVGSSNSRFSGRSRLQTRGKIWPISFTNARTMRNNVIVDFICLDRASGGCRIWNQLDLVMRDNHFITFEPIDFRGVANLRSSGDRYDCASPTVMTVRPYAPFGRDTANNAWDTVTLDARKASPGQTMPLASFSGDETHDNALVNATIWKSTGAADRTVAGAAANAIGNAAGARGNVLRGAATLNGKRL